MTKKQNKIVWSLVSQPNRMEFGVAQLKRNVNLLKGENIVAKQNDEKWAVVVKDSDDYIVFSPFNDFFHAKEYAENQIGDEVEIAQIIEPIYED